jgi:hypothetical protein
MSSHKDVPTLTCTVDVYGYVLDMCAYVVDVYGYVASNLVPEVLHEPIEHVTVLLDSIRRFREHIFSESFPCDDGGTLRRYRAQQVLTLTKVAGLRIILNKMGTLACLLRNPSKDIAHRRDLAEYLVLCDEAVDFRQLLKKFE